MCMLRQPQNNKYHRKWSAEEAVLGFNLGCTGDKAAVDPAQQDQRK